MNLTPEQLTWLHRRLTVATQIRGEQDIYAPPYIDGFRAGAQHAIDLLTVLKEEQGK